MSLAIPSALLIIALPVQLERDRAALQTTVSTLVLPLLVELIDKLLGPIERDFDGSDAVSGSFLTSHHLITVVVALFVVIIFLNQLLVLLFFALLLVPIIV